VLGFEDDDRVRLKQQDWPSAIRDAASFIAQRVTDKVEHAGGGTLDPLIEPFNWRKHREAEDEPPA